jgi:signal transduction histidine kinase
VRYGAAALVLEITDSGGSPSPAAASGSGRGLIGLRERLDLYGGSLHAGPVPGGGFRVRAEMPLGVDLPDGEQAGVR